VPNDNQLCWGGRCETHGKDGPDTWGQFKVDRAPTAAWDLDHILFKVTKQGGGIVNIVTKISAPVQPPSSVASCTSATA
jgi:hypothetical protein